MRIADRGDLTVEILPAFRDRLKGLLETAPFAYIAESSQLIDECILAGVHVSRGDCWGQKLCVDIEGYGPIFTLSVAPPEARHRLYDNIRYTFNRRSLFIVAMPSDAPRKLTRFYFIGR